MPETFARMRQLIGTTTDWAVNDIVIGLGEIAVEKAGGESRIKIGDGVTRFSALPYATGDATSVAWGNITGKPATFPPSAHNHALVDVTGLVDGSGKINLAIIPDTLKERMDWKGEHTPTLGAQYPLTPAAGDTWGILGPAFTFTTGTLSGKTVSEGAAIVYDAARWHIIGGGAGGAAGDFVEVADLTTTSTGPTMAGLVPQLNTSGRLDPSLLNVPGALNFRGTVNITLPVPSAVNQGDYYIVGIGGVAHASWTGIAGLTMLVQDQVIWTGVAWTYIRPAGAASGFLPIDGSAPMTGALSLAAYTAGQPAAAHAIRKDNLDARIAALPTAEASLGFLPLNPANNLSEVVNDATARSNLGLGTAATQPATAFIPTSLFTAASQMIVSSGAGAPQILPAPTAPGQVLSHGAGGISWELGSGAYLVKTQNLADVPDKDLARANLGVPDLADIILKSTIDAAGDLLVGTGPDAVARLGKGTTGQPLLSTAGGLAWGGEVKSSMFWGGEGDAGTLRTYNTGNGVNFAWATETNGGLVYRIDNSLERAICTQTNAKSLGYAVSGGPTSRSLNGYDRSDVLYGIFVDAISDSAAKERIADSATDALALIGQLKLRAFDYTADFAGPEHRHVPLGLVAQEVESVIPDLVASDFSDGLKRLNLKLAVPYLVRAVQQLTARLAELEAKAKT